MPGGKPYSEVRILKEIAELLNEGTEITSILSEALKKLLHVTKLEIGWIFLINEDGSFDLAAKEKLPPALAIEKCKPMCKGNCWCIDRFNDGRLKKATNIIECKRIEDAIEEQRGETKGLTHHATVPLRAGNEKFGVLNVGSPYKTHFDQEELALLESIAFQIGTAIKRIKLTQREQEASIVAERNRLARDLHDSVNQLLFSLNLTARGGAEMAKDQEQKEIFLYMQDLAQEALSEMRALIWQLRPRELEKGIVCALVGYGEMLGLTVDSQLTGIINLPGKLEEALWRIGQEALANCKKHSGQQKVTIKVTSDQQKIKMTISDEGCGFLYDEFKKIPSLGLNNMKKRTESLNGHFHLISEPGKGTTLVVNIPI